MRLRSREPFTTIRTEGGLLSGDLLQRVVDGELEGLDPTDYHLAPNERLNDAITHAWTRLQGAWKSFGAAKEALPTDDTGATVTRERWLHPLFDQLGYGRLVSEPAVTIEGKRYPVFSRWQNTPIHLVGINVPIDRRTKGVAGAAGQSPHSLLQELLNRSPERLWGIVSNGSVLRLLRDNVALTRQVYIEFDLEAIMEDEAYADFAVLWLTCHQSRVEGEDPSGCWLERWSQDSAAQGTRALTALREGVEQAIAALGKGFLSHPDNHPLQEALRDGTLAPADYYHHILRLVYRLLFLFVAEDRGALLVGEDAEARSRYARFYSTAQLRRRAMRRGSRGHGDLFVSLSLVMGKLHLTGCKELALPALGSLLWDPESIGELDGAHLSNQHLLEAVRELAFVEEEGVLRQVDFRNLGSEELGSVYESLLELHPEIDRAAARFTLRTAAGSDRKTTGSYYTPSGLISSLLDTALDPVLEQSSVGKDAEAAERALLDLKVCDPACGSGHFLIAAGNRIAKRLAGVRTGDAEPSPEALRTALRDVVGRCLYGVDSNPMAVELCKVSLWMEALEPGRPLSFLDHSIARGDSLLGVTPELIDAGLPEAAQKPIYGDDKDIAKALKRRTKEERKGFEPLFELGGGNAVSLSRLGGEALSLVEEDDRSLASLREKEQHHRRILASEEYRRATLAANAWCAAFFAPKETGGPAITARVVRQAIADPEKLDPALVEAVDGLVDRYAFFHWQIAFPEVFDDARGGKGGFDVMLGNPPWERLKLDEKEFFSTREPDLAKENKASRVRMIEELAEHDPLLFEEYENTKRGTEGKSHFARNSGRYPLCGRGDINTYALFAELNRMLINPRGRVGCIVPTGIATDDTTKHFFQDLIGSGALASLYDFENRERIFPAVDSRVKFCLMTLVGTAEQKPDEGADFCFFATRVEQIAEQERHFTLTTEEIALLNPNTLTCLPLRTRRDARLIKEVHRRHPVLVLQSSDSGVGEENRWGFAPRRVFDLNKVEDLKLFHDDAGNLGEPVPHYGMGQFHQFDHRFASYTRGERHPFEGHGTPAPANPRQWVERAEVKRRLYGLWDREWCLAWRDFARNTDERTCIAAILPLAATDFGVRLFNPQRWEFAMQILAVLNSHLFDYCLRLRLGGTHVSDYIMRQTPVPSPGNELEQVARLAFELTYTATDLEPLARDMGYDGEPFRWDEERRRAIRVELDARLFHVYGIGRDDVGYVMDTFPIVKRAEESEFGEFRNRREILEVYDGIAAALADGSEYESRLDPPPPLLRPAD